jgi:hypothetical protein
LRTNFVRLPLRVGASLVRPFARLPASKTRKCTKNTGLGIPTLIPTRLFKARIKRRNALIIKKLERVIRIELTYQAWEARVLPLNYTRAALRRGREISGGRQRVKNGL